LYLKNKLILILPIVSYFVVLYKSTWLPGNKLFLTSSFYVVEVLSLIVLTLFLDFSLLGSEIRLFQRENKYFFILFILLLISSVVYNFKEFRSIYLISYYLAYLFNFLIYFTLLPLFIVKNSIYFRKLLKFISYYSLAFSLVGLFFYSVGFGPEGRFEGMVTSIMIHPNFVPAVCLVGILSTLALFHTTLKEQILTKYLLFFSVVIQFLALALSYTRDGMIALIIGLSVFYFLSYRRYFLYTLPFSLAGVPFFVIAFVKTKGFLSFISRFVLLIPAYYLLMSDKTRLIWGYGASNSRDMYVKYKVLYNALEDVDSPHNSYISYILMYGLAFTLVFLWIVFLTLKKGFVFAFNEKDKNIRIYSSLFISVIVSYMVVNLFESHLAMVHLTMMNPFLIFFGLLFFAMRDRQFFDKFRNELT
jgi:hypothetical protein